MSDTTAPALDPGTAFFLRAFEPDARENPYPLYAEMRETAPLFDTGIGMWFAFTHEDCWEVVRSPDFSSDERRSTLFQHDAQHNPRLARQFEEQPILLFADPPHHTRLRSLVSRAFTPSTVAAMRIGAERLTAELVSGIADAGADGSPVDLIEAIAYPLPITIISDLMGVPEADREPFRAWSKVLTRSIDPGALRTEEMNDAIDATQAEIDDYVEELLRERRERPGDDLISALSIAVDGDDRLTAREIVDLCVLLLIAGHETTVGLIGNGMHALLTHPSQFELLRSQPQLGRNAIDELLRYDGTVQMVQRIATRTMTVRGVEIPEGGQMILGLASANRDPAVFADPDRLDITRANANRHLAFGGGIHHCIGAALARMEGQLVIEALVQAFPAMEPAGPVARRDLFNLRGLEHLPVTIR